MHLELTPADIALRLFFTLVAGALIGWDRGEHGRSAGLRTHILVCLASSASMLLANSLLATTGKASDSFVNLDVMRLPLGILTGIGFIGAGAIVRRGDSVSGVTTAATLWFVTVLGLCFGAGQPGLGFSLLALALVVIVALKRLERRLESCHCVALAVHLDGSGPSEEEMYRRLAAHGYQVRRWSSTSHGPERSVSCDLRWQAVQPPDLPPPWVEELRRSAGVLSVAWRPRN